MGSPRTKKLKATPQEEDQEQEKQVTYLRSLPSVRTTCQRVLEMARNDQLPAFKLDQTKMAPLADHLVKLIRENYPEDPASVPFHSRWRHFETGDPERVNKMTAKWTCDAKEKARRLVDLALVSVLLDAGAGPTWKYKEPGTNQVFSRSEGLGIASFHMFVNGAFSSDRQHAPQRVDADALIKLSDDAIAKSFQVNDKTNPLVGCKGRTELLQRLGHSLKAHPEFFGSNLTNQEKTTTTTKTTTAVQVFRPGHLVDFLVAKANAKHEISIQTLWKVVIYGLEAIWPPSRTKLCGQNMGDVWKLPALEKSPHATARTFVSFHKLSQWLTYSLMEPLQEAGVKLTELSLMTGLPEYRNGGLLVDFGLLIPKQDSTLKKTFEPSDPVIIEWRALTVALLDELHQLLLKRLKLTSDVFPLVKMLEGGSWKAGRLLAKAKRSDGSPPIAIKSDGTVF